MICALRWHISRIDPESDPKDPFIHATVSKETKAFQEKVKTDSLPGLLTTKEDQLNWWDIKNELEGFLLESVILKSYLHYPLPIFLNIPLNASEDRGLEEDMVLLQIIIDCDRELSLFRDLLRKWLEGGFPELTELTQLPNSYWLDFTLPARQMTKSLYEKVSGQFSDPSEEGIASKS